MIDSSFFMLSNFCRHDEINTTSDRLGQISNRMTTLKVSNTISCPMSVMALTLSPPSVFRWRCVYPRYGFIINFEEDSFDLIKSDVGKRNLTREDRQIWNKLWNKNNIFLSKFFQPLIKNIPSVFLIYPPMVYAMAHGIIGDILSRKDKIIFVTVGAYHTENISNKLQKYFNFISIKQVRPSKTETHDERKWNIEDIQDIILYEIDHLSEKYNISF